MNTAFNRISYLHVTLEEKSISDNSDPLFLNNNKPYFSVAPVYFSTPFVIISTPLTLGNKKTQQKQDITILAYWHKTCINLGTLHYLKETPMQTDNLDVYAQFLLDCKKVMGTLDFDKLTNDSEYKAELFSRIALSADDKIFEMASLVSQELDAEESQSH